MIDCTTEQDCLQIFKQFFDTAPFPVSIACVDTPSEALVYINPAFTVLTGYESADILGQSCRLLQGTNRQQDGRAIIRQAINDGVAGQAEFVNYRKDGSMFWNSVKVVPWVTDCPNKYMLGFQLDITALVHPQLALEYALQREKVKHIYELHQARLATIGSMSAMMAHEINNPISGVIVNMEYLQLSQTSQNETQEVLSESLQELKRVSRLIKGMLGFSRKSDQQIDRICSVRCVFDETLLIAEPLLKSASVMVHYDQNNLTLEQTLSIDAEELKQVLLNLITNAVHSMGEIAVEKRRISFDCILLPEQNQAVLSLSDTGVGVSKAIKDKIFDPFFTTKPQGEGTGLGLSLSAKLIQDAGGVLRLDEDYTSGARFLLYLPLMSSLTAPLNLSKLAHN